MKKKRVLSIVLAAAMITGMAAGCGSDGGGNSGKDAKGKVYYLNFKPTRKLTALTLLIHPLNAVNCCSPY